MFDENNYEIKENDKLRNLQIDLRKNKDGTINYLLANLPSSLEKLKPI